MATATCAFRDVQDVTMIFPMFEGVMFISAFGPLGTLGADPLLQVSRRLYNLPEVYAAHDCVPYRSGHYGPKTLPVLCWEAQVLWLLKKDWIAPLISFVLKC